MEGSGVGKNSPTPQPCLKVVSVISDQGPNFRKFFKNPGVTPQKPYFTHCGYKIFVIPDVVMEVIAETYKYCNENKDGELSMISKVTLSHIFLPKFAGKMKVKYATQILSNSMGAAMKILHTMKCFLVEPELPEIYNKLLSTSEFCYRFNNLFDILNSSFGSPSKNPFKKFLSIDDDNWKYLDDCKKCWRS